MAGSFRVFAHKAFFDEKRYSSALDGKAMYRYEGGLDAWSSKCRYVDIGKVRDNCFGSVVIYCCVFISSRDQTCVCVRSSTESRSYLHVSSDVLSSSASVMRTDCELVIVSSLRINVAAAAMHRRELLDKSLAERQWFSGFR